MADAARHATLPEPTTEAVYQAYLTRRDRFVVPERRRVSHILITVQDQFPENREAAVRRRIGRLAERLALLGDSESESALFGRCFADLAQRHSECPTAMQRGELGWVTEGQLFPELDAAVFRLREGTWAGPLRSELGYHLVWCQTIEAPRHLRFDEVEGKLRAALAKRPRR